MKGHENLIPNSERSPDEVRKNSAKGGVKSGVTRRRRKAIKEILAGAWNIRLCDIEDPGVRKAFMTAAKSQDGEITIGEAMTNGMVLAMIRGNALMSQLVLDLMKESPAVKLKEKELRLRKREIEIREKLAEKDLQEDEPSAQVEFTFEREK